MSCMVVRTPTPPLHARSRGSRRNVSVAVASRVLSPLVASVVLRGSCSAPCGPHRPICTLHTVHVVHTIRVDRSTGSVWSLSWNTSVAVVRCVCAAAPPSYFVIPLGGGRGSRRAEEQASLSGLFPKPPACSGSLLTGTSLQEDPRRQAKSHLLLASLYFSQRILGHFLMEFVHT